MNGGRARHAAIGPALLLLAATLQSSVLVAAEPTALPAAARILDDDILVYSWPYPSISPDGKWVAYISRGYLCLAEVANATSRRLAELPGSTSHVLCLPQYAPATGSDNALTRVMSPEERQQFQALVRNQPFGLQWTPDSSALAYATSSQDADRRLSLCDFWLTTLDGAATKLAHVENKFDAPYFGQTFILSRDRKFIVADQHHPRPLIWEVARNMPRATPYLALTPSTTSGRWLAVEKDTRQLVVLDEEFNVARRIEEFVPRPPVSDHVQLHWSPDERHMIWRIPIGFDHTSNWEGCRLDLQTKQRRVLTGAYMKEVVCFTGRGGEFLCIGGEGVQGGSSGLTPTSVYVQVIPQGTGFARPLWSLRAMPFGDGEPISRLGSIPPVVCSPDFELFVIGLPRQEGPYGAILHLLDRQRGLWQLSSEDNDGRHSPYEVVGFAEDGKTLIGYDAHRLFAIPLTAIKKPENKVR